MRETIEEFGVERAWALLVGGGALVLALGSALFPRTVYVDFIWHYFWGPVYADGKNVECVAWANGNQHLVDSVNQCQQLLANPGSLGPVAHPGYTPVSEIGYAATLLVMLVGVGILIRRLGISRYREGYYALVPWMFFGGALRVVEDANNMADATGHAPAIAYPLNAFIISPVIYFTVFVFALIAVVAGVYLERHDYVSGYEYPLAGIGAVLLALNLAYLVFLSVDTDYVEFHLPILLVVLAGAIGSTLVTWWLIERYKPELNAGTGYIGLLIIFGQAVDGAANVVGLDWAKELGLAADLVPKHPVNRFVVNLTQSILPASVIAVTGDAWPFMLLKLAAAVAVVWIFTDEVFEDNPQFTIMLLVAVLAVGLGPGTRDMLRATFGV